MRITPLFSKAGLAVAAVTLAILPATAVKAAGKTPSILTLSGLPATIDYGQFQQTVRGTLTTRVPAGQTPEPISGATIQLSEGLNQDVTLGTATTDENGDFSLPVTLPAPGVVQAYFAGDDTHALTRSGSKVAPAATLPTKVTLSGPASAEPNATIDVTGQVTVQTPDGTWVPAPYATVSPSGTGVGGFVKTGADGRFSFTAQAAHGYAPTALVYTDGTFARMTRSEPLVTPYSSYPVQIRGFGGKQDPMNPGHVGFFAGASYEPDDVGTAPYHGPVILRYLPKGSKTWIQMATRTATGSYGSGQDFQGSADFANLSGFLPGGKGVLAAGGTWEVQTPANGPFLAGTNPDGVSASPRIYAPTYVTGSKVTSRAGKRYLTGYLNDDHTVGPVPRMKIKVYYQKTKSSTHKYLGYVTTGSDGRFSYKLTGHARGYYQAVFAGAAMPGGMDVGYFYYSTGALVYYR
ncbi:hypothetical protein GCM10023195_16680 [Actinoallomurus liliacearum]|uniref:Alpha-amylase n=1 Tax=Actinoallomurus liliacearum TaxID=1080073 RepID=A0ABP8TCX1_9ACTN